MTEYSFPRYLAAKQSVDDRSLNARTWNALRNVLQGFGEEPVRTLEVGAGIGTMLQRMISAGMFQQARYHMIDAMSENIESARSRLDRWAKEAGWRVGSEPGLLRIKAPESQVDVSLEIAELYAFAEQARGQQTWDLVVANAFLDLFDIPAALSTLCDLSHPGGWFYFSINFDGVTAVEPEIDATLDKEIIDLYHRSMDERVIDGKVSGDSQAGRHLFQHLRDAGLEIVEAGGSDWVVFARNGEYSGDEAYFLRHVLHFFEETLPSHPDLNERRFQAWLDERRSQIERGELVYIAHQLDFLARRPIKP
jgi:SAM-dependent methyltransferase